MCVNNLPKVATQWNSGMTRDSNRGRRVLIPSALTTTPPSHTMCAFLLAVGYNHALILNGYRDMGPERYLGYDLDLLGSRDVIGRVTIVLATYGFL